MPFDISIIKYKAHQIHNDGLFIFYNQWLLLIGRKL